VRALGAAASAGSVRQTISLGQLCSGLGGGDAATAPSAGDAASAPQQSGDSVGLSVGGGGKLRKRARPPAGPATAAGAGKRPATDGAAALMVDCSQQVRSAPATGLRPPACTCSECL
jgi:hypothetical protein